ncbi:MAG: Dyp-type peroxidase [Pseudomonadales bacterium]
MTKADAPHLDHHDIQGNILKAYARYNMPRARYVFYSIHHGATGRQFVRMLTGLITSAAKWGDNPGAVERPLATTNLAFTYAGLAKLGVPQKSLQSFPQEFCMGMAARADILGDDGPSAPEHWDPIWCDSAKPVHIWLSINAASESQLEARYREICDCLQRCNGDGAGIEQLCGHRGADGRADLPYQSATALLNEAGNPTPKEHFGFTDGISNPFFKGCGGNPANVIGGGKPTRGDPATPQGWAPLETGEFILGYRDEAFEYPAAPIPRMLAMNGTFMVYRKLHQNVASFKRYTQARGEALCPHHGVQKLRAKMAGRWDNGAPLSRFATPESAAAFSEDLAQATEALKQADSAAAQRSAQAAYATLRLKLTGFNYSDDLAGAACPIGAHIRRTNPRGALEYGVEGAYNTPGALVNRRRILRRGLPYGSSEQSPSDEGDHGIIFMALNANIERQFEFVQQQWVNYSNDFKLANDKDPLIGNQALNDTGKPCGRMVIQADPDGQQPPFFCDKLPRFVETRGGDYFFVPSISALCMIGDGLIDPT